jgi:hypothetical protein
MLYPIVNISNHILRAFNVSVVAPGSSLSIGTMWQIAHLVSNFHDLMDFPVDAVRLMHRAARTRSTVSELI